MTDKQPALNDELATMISDLSHTGELSMLYRMAIADRITELRAALDAAEGRGTVKPVWAVTALVEKPGTIGFRSVQVTGGNENEALGCGMQQIQKLNPGWSVQSPAALRINIEPTPAPSDKIAEAARDVIALWQSRDFNDPQHSRKIDEAVVQLSHALAGKGE